MIKTSCVHCFIAGDSYFLLSINVLCSVLNVSWCHILLRCPLQSCHMTTVVISKCVIVTREMFYSMANVIVYYIRCYMFVFRYNYPLKSSILIDSKCKFSCRCVSNCSRSNVATPWSKQYFVIWNDTIYILCLID